MKKQFKILNKLTLVCLLSISFHGIVFSASVVNPKKAIANYFNDYKKLGFDQKIIDEVQRQLIRNKYFQSLDRSGQDQIYLGFLKYIQNMKFNLSQTAHFAEMKELISRLQESSTQFLICEDMNDWKCLEEIPILTPKQDFRQDTTDDLGEPVYAGEKLEIEDYFTTTWFDYQNQKNLITTKGAQRDRDKQEIRNFFQEQMRGPRQTVAKVLAHKIETEADQGLWMAMYGIDDIEDSMKSVYDAIVNHVKQNRFVQLVVDVASEGQPNQFLKNYEVKIEPNEKILETNITFSKLKENELDFSYIQPSDTSMWVFGRAKWQDQVFDLGQNILAEYQKRRAQDKNTPEFKPAEVAMAIFGEEQSGITNDIMWNMGLMKQYVPTVKKSVRIGFQYDGSLELIKLLNNNIENNQSALARIEWPAQSLMHNKYMVMKDKLGHLGLWSGTANIAQTCMGFESNSNMSVYIKNEQISQTFLNEFNEMFESQNGLHQEKNLVTGQFHKNKKPNTKRYFTFKDGTEVKVHFSPTDDGEHRSIIPFLLSAQHGDVIRISMFGGSGIETTRALQMAVARGAQVRVLLDAATSSGKSMWPKHPVANLLELNPYVQDIQVQQNLLNSMQVRYSAWEGLNHHKTATIERNGKTVAMIIGSQNWSESGNDENDENMLTFRNLKSGLDFGDNFNKEFDQRMWLLTIDARTAGNQTVED